MTSLSLHQKRSKPDPLHKKDLQEGCEVLEAVKAIGKMIVLFYNTWED